MKTKIGFLSVRVIKSHEVGNGFIILKESLRPPLIWTLTGGKDYITEIEKVTGKELEGFSRGREILSMAGTVLIENNYCVCGSVVNISIPLNELWICLNCEHFHYCTDIIPTGVKRVCLINILKMENMHNSLYLSSYQRPTFQIPFIIAFTTPNNTTKINPKTGFSLCL